MNRCLLFALLLLTGPVLGQTGDSKAGIPYSPTMPWGYSTATYAPPGGFTQHPRSGYYYGSFGAGYYGHYGYGNSDYGTSYYGSSALPGSYSQPFGSAPAGRSAGRNWPSARDESRLHEIRR